jgi:hypothetical protein
MGFARRRDRGASHAGRRPDGVDDFLVIALDQRALVRGHASAEIVIADVHAKYFGVELNDASRRRATEARL